MEAPIVFKRKIYSKLLEWKNSPIRNSALLIEGARRVGKSTVALQFAKNEYPDYIMVDFRKEGDQTKALFDNTKDLDDFFRRFFLSQNHVLKPGGLIIFDEVQFCPKAREAIKDFVADGRYDFIETGSLISIKENTEGIMIPSEERRVEMYPMDFEEYLWAMEANDSFSLFKTLLERRESVDEGTHRRYMGAFRTYMIIGGMPKVISIFKETNSFKLADEEKRDILKLYRDDLRKHDNKYGTCCQAVFDSIPSQLSKPSKRFLFKSGTGKKRFDQISKSIDDLSDFKIVNRVNSLSSLEGPLRLFENDSRFKLYFCDTGLLASMLFPFSAAKVNTACLAFILNGTGFNLGAMFESIAVQQLVLQGTPVYYHVFDLMNRQTKKATRYELDLVVERDFKVTAIEVKSSKNYTTSSLDHIKVKYPQLKIQKQVFGVKNLKAESDKTTFPIYLVLFL